MKRLGDDLSRRLRHDPDPSETGNNPNRHPKWMRRPQKAVDRRLTDFIEFLDRFVDHLNKQSEDGWVLLVEGPRDSEAMRKLGYAGTVLTSSSPLLRRSGALKECSGVVILTDLDREGRRLAAKHAKMLSREGVRLSLSERRRLLTASGGVFRHVENLRRFADRLRI